MRFSVVLCTFNGERFLTQQIESLVRQTRPADEIIVRDDGSTDRTIALLKAHERLLPIRIAINDSNLGSTANFERTIAEANGDLIALCDQDDVWEPRKLERLEVAFRPGVGLVFTDAELIDDHGRQLGRRLWDAIGFHGTLVRDFRGEPLRVFSRGKNVITGATMAFRSELRKVVLPIPDIWTHDGWIAIVVTFAASIVMLPEALIRYRIHAGQQLGLTPAASQISRQPELLLRQSRQYEAVIDRVRSFADSRRLRWLEEMVEHVKTRTEMPSFRTERIRQIARELRAGRYHCYSNGLRSAFKDLLSR
jgi:glycosyltransferase involved in cell wall biosynthesis